MCQGREGPAGLAVGRPYSDVDSLSAARASEASAPEQPTLGPLPSYASVRRYLKANGLFRQPRAPARHTAGTEAAAQRRVGFEIRSYESAHTNALWHADYHHGSRPVLTRAGRWETPVLLGVLDDHSRLACHVQWYLEESAESFVPCEDVLVNAVDQCAVEIEEEGRGC